MGGEVVRRVGEENEQAYENDAEADGDGGAHRGGQRSFSFLFLFILDRGMAWTRGPALRRKKRGLTKD